MGWLMFLIVGAVSVFLLFVLGVPRLLWSLLGAAIALGGTGYALQGHPFEPGHPVEGEAEIQPIDQGLIDFRHTMFGHFTFANSYLVASDALARSGATDSAVGVVLAGIHRSPRDAALWTWLGMAYSEHDGGFVSPAAEMAFNHAMAIAPQHPGPPFFYGFALARAGRLEDARATWRRALARMPEDSPLRRDVRLRLQLLDGFLSQPAGTQPAM
ncbi:tetratricopeptide repeat protein [Stakelama saccharophila]|uniref:Uncharacterized protein n=1 Tax=Stakelama saccharophila TaxID=3075605 RepID=A0ABZ0B5N5_9SPHN|nr:hypothetical protein [Stakelama sp. W311]WNO52605.1 hypothetical protein RPR59_08985 [Stakelama sp. W311]